jgi:predicted ArsR family transcriptional regulator
MPPTIHAQILEYLDRNPAVSAEEISRALNVTKENIQYHLKILLQDETIERTAISANKTTPRGRPTYLYRLSAQSRQGDIPALADKLLELVLITPSPLSSQPDWLTRLASAMFPFQPSTNPTQHLRQTIQRLNQHHYRATWEARAAGPYVYFRSCPYAGLIKRHPELCQLDCAILASILDKTATQISKMDLDSRKPPACVFLVK